MLSVAIARADGLTQTPVIWGSSGCVSVEGRFLAVGTGPPPLFCKSALYILPFCIGEGRVQNSAISLYICPTCPPLALICICGHQWHPIKVFSLEPTAPETRSAEWHIVIMIKSWINFFRIRSHDSSVTSVIRIKFIKESRYFGLAA